MTLRYQSILFFILITLALVGLFSPGIFNLLPVKNILEASIFLLILSQIGNIHKHMVIFAYISFIYIIYSYIYIYLFVEYNKLSDFIMIYKTFAYIIMLSFFVQKKIFDANFISKLFYILLFIFLLKYFYSITLHIAHRPGIYTENNFELLFLILLYIAKNHYDHKIYSKDIFILTIIILLSGSRSAVLSLFILFLFLDFGKENYKKIIKSFLLLLLFIIMIFVFIYRLEDMNINDIDRVQFMYVFLSELQNWDFINYLFGSPPITPLSYESCTQLNFYKPLFSDVENNLCYSVILHSYIFRIIFDHGLLGLSFVIYFLIQVLQYTYLEKRYIFMVLSILFANSLSVSSFNSVFTILGLIILISSYKKEVNE